VAFFNHWYDPATHSNFHDKLPYVLSLGVDHITREMILVTKAHGKTFRRLSCLREDDRAGHTVR